jgi:tRNA-Thr(GGU) m(6)t(6)A37 methyltransferase TsaA
MVTEYEQAREKIKKRLLSAIREDARVVGCLDYGATGHRRGDQWADLDLALIIQEKEMARFESDWQVWAAQFGDLLLAYNSFVGHPWAVYDTGVTPLRIDFSFKSDAFIPDLTILTILPLSPARPEEMVLYDDTGGALFAAVSGLAGKSLEPPDPQGAFTQACGDFWTMLLRCHTRLLREEYWSARHDFQVLVLPTLIALLRLLYGTTGKWLASNPPDGVEAVLDHEALARLKACIPDRDDRDLQRAMLETAEFGAETCSQLFATYGWEWPEKLAQKTLTLFSPGVTEISALPPLYIKPIGIVQNSIEALLPPKEIKAVLSRIIVDPVLTEGLDGLTGNQRLLVIFQFHKLAGYELHQHPKNNAELPKKGIFALHSPKRPNPIGVTEVDLLRREGNILYVRGLDAVNGTPVLDLKLNS